MTSSKKGNINNNKDYSDDVDGDGIVFEETGQTEEKIKKLKAKLDKCLKENKENLLGWQRARADFVNAKKENNKKIKESFAYAKSELINELLPVMDSFDMAFSNKEAWENVDKNWRTGVEYIHSQLTTILENNGLKQIDPKGQRFDPKFHASIETIATDDKKEDGIIMEVVQKGYELNGNVLRAAKVKVGQYKK